jgi:RNA polymerase sigma-70 factor (ECF subfamily)
MEASHEISLHDDWRGHAAALQGLARALCGDEHEAEDLVQETWLRSGRLPEGANRRPWLRTVLQNLVRDQSRVRDRRAAGELTAARVEALPSDSEILERLEVAERVAREVARLPEPYRTAIHLRYFEGLAPAEIARRADLPIETVRTRLRRGLELLRGRMDKLSEGGRSAWLSALAPIALRTDPGVTLTAGSSLAAIGGAVMSAKALFSVAAAAAVVLCVFLAWPEKRNVSPSSSPAVQAAASELDPSGRRAETTAPAPALETDRSAAPRPRETAAAKLEPDDGQAQVRGEGLKRGRLRVVDASTKQDLRGVEVRCARGWRANPESSHPGDSALIETVIQGADSPFDLPERSRLTPYWIHADGHAWARIDFDHRVGGERIVELAAPGSVEVSISDGVALPGAFLRLYPSDRPTPSWIASVSMRVSSEGVTRVDDFEPGSYFACVEVGEYDATKRLGGAPVEVRAGERASVTIPLSPPGSEGSTVHLFGTLILPAGFEAIGATLRIWRQDGGAKRESLRIEDLPVVDGNELVRRWDVGAVPTGIWGAALAPMIYRQVIHAEQPGEMPVEIRVPDLVTLPIEVLDAADGSPIEAGKVDWSDAGIQELTTSFRASVPSAGGTGRYLLTAPAGTIAVSCNAPGYAAFEVEIELRANPPPLRIELRRTCGVVVQLFENDARVRADFRFWGDVRAFPEGGRIPTGKPGRSTELEKVFLFDEPGRYRIEFPALDGFEPIERMVVDVPPMQMADLRVPVRRK